MKRKLLLLLLLLPLVAKAYDAYINGIYYNFSGNEATVTYRLDDLGSYSGSVIIPSSITYSGKTYSVTSIGDFAFYTCGNLTSITIPNSVTSIGVNAFLSCSGLNAVHITDIAAWCSISFANTSSQPLLYAHHLYLNGQKIKILIIPDVVTSINSSVFCDCTDLTSVTIPNSVTSIGGGAFSGCSSLSSITIPNSVTSIGSRTFYGCSSLSSITIPNSVTSIGDFAFGYCSGLTSITIPNSVTSISDDVFYECI